MSRKKSEPVDFEQAMNELEGIVARLEQGDVPLEESLRQFERGIALTRSCQEALKSAEQRVELLAKRGAQAVETTDFAVDDDSVA